MDPSKVKNVLIINVHSTMNAGDAALLWLNIKQLEQVFPNCLYHALVNYPDEQYLMEIPGLKVLPSPFTLVEAGTNNPGWKKILKLVFGCALMLLAKMLPLKWLLRSSSQWLRIAGVMRACDVIVAVSGAQLVSFGKYSWPLIVSSTAVVFAHYYRKPLYVMPQSLGPYRWGWEKRLVRSIYSRARLLFLRDAISMRLAEEIGLPASKTIFAFDPGFALPASPPERAVELLSKYGYVPGAPAIGVTVIARISKTYDPATLANYYHAFAEALVRFATMTDARVFVFDQVRGPTPGEDDCIAAEALLERLGENQGKVVHVNQRLNPLELKACYGLMDLFIASRLHSGIFAMSSGVPTIFVGYNPKTKGFLQAAGLGQLLLEINDLDSERVWQLLYQTWENRQMMAEKTVSVVNECRKDFGRVAQLIAEDYCHA